MPRRRTSGSWDRRRRALLYVREDRIEEIWPNIVAPGWGTDAEPDVRGARKFESLGQRDDACLAAVATAAAFHEAIGAAEVEARVSALATVLKEGMAALGMTLVTPLDPGLSGGVCIMEAPGDRGAALDGLYEAHGIAGAGTGGLRLCPHVYNTMAHVERAVEGDPGTARGDCGVRWRGGRLTQTEACPVP